jgi:hypothetical protein
LVNSPKRALDYAAGGFHVSVDRQNGGGCADSWEIHNGGTVAAACKQPQNRADLATLWGNAAGKYKAAFEATKAGAALPTVVNMLRDANSAADAAFAGEGIAPPRDPATSESQGASNARSGFWNLGTGLGLAAVVGVVGWYAYDNLNKDDSGGHFMGAGRKRRR